MSPLCPNCGAPILTGAQKCEYCGSVVAQPQQQPQPQPQYQPQYQPQPQVIYVQQPIYNERLNWPIKNKRVAALLALLLGWIGIHKFYLGENGKGIAYLLFCWTFVPLFLSILEAIIIFCSNDENFMIKYRCRILKK